MSGLRAATLYGSGCQRASDCGAARLATALDDIAACFQDPELRVAVTQRQRILPRYLQRLLKTSGIFTARGAALLRSIARVT
jgi:hypothetical protein